MELHLACIAIIFACCVFVGTGNRKWEVPEQSQALDCPVFFSHTMLLLL